jgi:1,2-dihydroxy-3-keto-5-methylthiopentene dioxygenase
MALLRIPDEQRTIEDPDEIARYLASKNIEYEKMQTIDGLADNSPADAVLAHYATKIDELKAKGGYVTADVIDVKSDTPNLEVMLAKFNSEHWHDEDEVRLIVEGRGLFHIHPPGGPVFSIEVVAGDLIRVPRGTHHWFDLCGDRRIRAIRLFQDMSGWTPQYTGSGVDQKFQPLCFGPAYIPAARVTPGVAV